ncbi:hypothetical protein HDU85_000059 [Gaertneriomyces sp. JEL0708]|nr:hypothetical protein HDU85_000059 [Gaertneriomyces sp. JEL0708]
MASKFDNLENWAADRLSLLLGLGEEDVRPMIPYLMSIPTAEELSQHLSGILGDDPLAVEFIQDFNVKRFPPIQKQGAWLSQLKVKEEQKPALVEQAQETANAQNGYRRATAEEGRSNAGSLPPSADGSLVSDRLYRKNAVHGKAKKAGRKDKVNIDNIQSTLDDIEGMVKVGNAPAGFGGRVVCECLAAKHGLVTNCLNCGKIVCRLEGPGPCPCCGTPVTSKQQQLVLLQEKAKTERSKPKTKDSFSRARYGQAAGAQVPRAAAVVQGPQIVDTMQFPDLMTEKERQDLERAQAQAEKLLDFQRNSAARTKVHDEASDFDFQQQASNKWLSAEERADAQAKAREHERQQEEQKRRRVITLDLVNKRVLTEKVSPKKSVTVAPQDIAPARLPTPPPDPGSTGQFRNPTLNVPAPVFVAAADVPQPVAPKNKQAIPRRKAAEAEARRKADAEAARNSSNSSAHDVAKKQSKWKPQIKRIQNDLDGFMDLTPEMALDEFATDGGDEPACG